MSRRRFLSSGVTLGLGLAIVAAWQPWRSAVTAAAPAPSTQGIHLNPTEARALCLSPLPGEHATGDAIRLAQDRVRALPTKSEEWVRLGWAWVRTARSSGDPGFYLNVGSCVDEALRLTPDHLAARALRGVVLMNGHRFDDARQEAERILATDPQNAIALSTLSDAMLELGRFEDAVAAAQRSVDLKPDASGYTRASYFRWLTGDTTAAKRFIRLALNGRDRRDPEPVAWTFVEAAKMFWHAADYDGADAVLAEALRWVPDYPPALVARGRVVMSQGDAPRAVTYLEQAARRQPLPETLWLLADAKTMLGDVSGADTASERVVQAGLRSDKLTLALFYATKNRSIDDAVRLIDEERRSRGGLYVDDTYAWVLYRAGRLAEARQASDRALRLGTPDARLLYHAGAIQMAAGIPAGRALIEKALALNPHFDLTGVAEARALLARRTS